MMQAEKSPREAGGRSLDMPLTACADRSAKHSRAQLLRVRVEAMIERELARCERTLTPARWIEHREWVTANVVEAARLWLREQAARGEL
ncbi:hypothetical protein [Paraburkholderia antibiotica]|uniref:Uncharacterized protein n=1 Tax=Paraburkholderia antibiotica TaxID=2728839 RepID=A0A7X9X1N2_9BURK|nr:hypothetical protein [Paraburkholderia antibiotica]NML29397.1 hypothetical protein [Paraburkholderia antibiotica]